MNIQHDELCWNMMLIISAVKTADAANILYNGMYELYSNGNMRWIAVRETACLSVACEKSV